MSLNKFEYNSDEFIIIKEKETFEQSKVSCLDRGYQVAAIDESDISKISEKMHELSIDAIKFLFKNVASISSSDCYNLLIKGTHTVYLDTKCSDDFGYGFKSKTLCKRATSQTDNAKKYTTQMINTVKSSINPTLVAIIASLVAFLLIISIICVVKTIKNRRNNRRPEQVCLCFICQIKSKSSILMGVLIIFSFLFN